MKEENLKTMDTFLNWKGRLVLFLSSQAISLFGSSLVQFAIMWYIARTTNSGMMITISTICSFLPQIIISLFAGVWADRYNRKFLIIVSDGLIAVSTFILAMILLTGHENMWVIFLVSAIRSLGSGVQMPAVSALIPQLVPEDQLMRVNGINGTIQSIIFLVSPAVSGTILTYGEFQYILFIDVITAAIGIFILLQLKVKLHHKAAQMQDTDYFYDLKEGIKYAINHGFVRRLVVFYAVFNFLVVPAAFLNVLLVTRVFGGEYWKLTANEMSFFIGSIAGGIIMASWGGFKNRLVTLAVACCAFGVFTVGVGVTKVFFIYLGIMALTGMIVPFFNSPAMVLLQEKVETDMQGRVFSFVQIAASGVMPIGMMLFGPLADIIKIETLMIITGILMFVVGISVLYNKGFMKEGLKTEVQKPVEL